MSLVGTEIFFNRNVIPHLGVPTLDSSLFALPSSSSPNPLALGYLQQEINQET
jgi:hypothetical protein